MLLSHTDLNVEMRASLVLKMLVIRKEDCVFY